MRPLDAIAAGLMLACAVPAVGRADGYPPIPTAAAVAAPSCPCPPRHNVWRAHRVRHYVRHWAPWPPPPPPPVAVWYDPPIPSPWDPAYDRAMVLHYRSPWVSGIFLAEPGYPPTPPVHGVRHYRVVTGGTVVQYDGMADGYVPLSQWDSRQVVAAMPPAAPPR